VLSLLWSFSAELLELTYYAFPTFAVLQLLSWIGM
jgi:hypothetical protein